MTLRTMRRTSAVSLFCIAALALLAARAEAQTAYVNITKVTIAGEEKKVATPVYINATECDQEFVFKLANVASTIPVMEAWVTGSGTDCFQATNRSYSGTSTPSCWRAGTQSGVTGEFKFPLRGGAIFNGSAMERGDPLRSCPPGAFNQQFTVYFVPLASSSDNSGTTAPMPIAIALKSYATFTLYTKRPAAPTNIRVTNGERALTVKWDRVDTNPLTRYRAFFDYGTGGTVNPMCGSDQLEFVAQDGESDAGTDIDSGTASDAGAITPISGDVPPPRNDAPNVEYVTSKGESASLKELDAIPYGRAVAVGVSVIDATGNVGYLSERRCVTRIPTRDLIDACEESEDCGLESCSLSPGRTGGAISLSMFALALTALIRRRRSA